MLKSPPQTLQSLGGAAEAAAVLVVPTPGALPAAPGLVARAGGRSSVRCRDQQLCLWVPEGRQTLTAQRA